MTSHLSFLVQISLKLLNSQSKCQGQAMRLLEAVVTFSQFQRTLLSTQIDIKPGVPGTRHRLGKKIRSTGRLSPTIISGVFARPVLCYKSSIWGYKLLIFLLDSFRLTLF